MIPLSRTNSNLGRNNFVSALAYMTLIAAFSATIVVTVAGMWQRRDLLNASTDILRKLERATVTPTELSSAAGSDPLGSPYLEGQTVTVASAALLQRVTAAILRAGGSVVSTEIEPQGAADKDGYIRMIANCELDERALQSLLYEIETGMPFLFIEQFTAQSSVSVTDGGRMRLLLGVSGLWRAEQ
jgi:general secretion pathway protein M